VTPTTKPYSRWSRLTLSNRNAGAAAEILAYAARWSLPMRLNQSTSWFQLTKLRELRDTMLDDFLQLAPVLRS
jgi:hypothetical protein